MRLERSAIAEDGRRGVRGVRGVRIASGVRGVRGVRGGGNTIRNDASESFSVPCDDADWRKSARVGVWAPTLEVVDLTASFALRFHRTA